MLVLMCPVLEIPTMAAMETFAEKVKRLKKKGLLSAAEKVDLGNLPDTDWMKRMESMYDPNDDDDQEFIQAAKKKLSQDTDNKDQGVLHLMRSPESIVCFAVLCCHVWEFCFDLMGAL